MRRLFCGVNIFLLRLSALSGKLSAMEALPLDIGLSLDMTDVARLRTWAGLAHDDGHERTAEALLSLSDNMDTMIREVGQMRAALGLSEVEQARKR